MRVPNLAVKQTNIGEARPLASLVPSAPLFATYLLRWASIQVTAKRESL